MLFSDHWLVLTGVLLLLTEELVDLFANLTLWNLDIILGSTVFGHKGEKAVVGDVELAKTVSLMDGVVLVTECLTN
jgi:hypothetical protein